MGFMDSLSGLHPDAQKFFSELGPSGGPQSKVDTSFPRNQSKPTGYSDVLNDVAETYPALAPHAKNAIVYDAPPPTENATAKYPKDLETYPPWEDWNPHPGKTTVELYKSFQSRPELRDALAGDMIHIAGAIHPETGKPVDPVYYGLKQQVKKARSPEQIAKDYRAYKQDQKEGEDRSFSKWFNNSRSEAYVRGRLFPDKNDSWKHFYDENPKLASTIDRIGSYLRTGKDTKEK